MSDQEVFDRRAIALRLAVDWLSNDDHRIDVTISGDVIQTRQQVTDVADYFFGWLIGRYS